MQKQKKSTTKKTQKAIVTQDNRFVYAKYDMNANELKFFMWIVAQINSQKDQLFKVCEIPLSEIFEVWQWKENVVDYTYCCKIVDAMSRKVYIEDFKLLDETTMKEVGIFSVMPIFKFIKYKEGDAYITYQLNDVLEQYLLNLKGNFTQLKFNDIQQMKSAYSIRIYNMLLAELKQNKQSLKINLAVLQNLLEVPPTLNEYKHFNQKVITQVIKDINAKSNIVLFEIIPHKTGRKVTDLEFLFDYKNNEKRIKRDEEKAESYRKALEQVLSNYIGKRVSFDEYPQLGILTIENYTRTKDNKRVAVEMRTEEGQKVNFLVKNFKSINDLQKAKEKANELFYLNPQSVKQLQSK